MRNIRLSSSFHLPRNNTPPPPPLFPYEHLSLTPPLPADETLTVLTPIVSIQKSILPFPDRTVGYRTHGNETKAMQLFFGVRPSSPCVRIRTPEEEKTKEKGSIFQATYRHVRRSSSSFILECVYGCESEREKTFTFVPFSDGQFLSLASAAH